MTPEQEKAVQEALQNIFDLANLTENYYTIEQVIKINEALNIEILM